MEQAARARGEFPPLTGPLRLAEKWARHRHDPTSRGGAIFAGEKVEPVVQIHHGSAPIVVRDLGKCLMVLGAFELPDTVRTRLAAIAPEERTRFLEELEEVLTSCPRVGFGLGPAGVVDAAELRHVVLDQTLQISENDPSSFNRFCDAIQETETILLRTAGFVQRFFEPVSGPLRYSSGAPPPTEIYL